MVRSETRAIQVGDDGKRGTEAFAATDWLLLSGTALTWGSSFVWIEIGLDSFSPPLITLMRVVFGILALAAFRKARAPIDKADLPKVALLGFLWMALPFLLFPIGQQWIDSSLAGMINGGVPIFAAVFSSFFLRRRLHANTLVAILIGFAGVLAVGWPAVQGSRATAAGAGLVLLATMSYGVALNLAAPLQQRYGALPVLLRAQLASLAIVIGPGVYGATQSEFSWPSLGAIVPLGCLGTGLAFVWMTTLVGRTGPVRASITIYFVPIIAIALGAIFRDETVSIVSLGGTALVLVGAYLTSRAQTGPANESARA
ncbi:MAG TPA: DMT family transporter [Actinomycetota bacterium]|jgi:drug/metabolite transporter (DMT)-like permease